MRPLTKDERDHIFELLQAHHEWPEIAEAAGVSVSTVRAIAIEHGLFEPATALPWDAQPWSVDAVCAETDPEAFFPEKGGSTRAAKAMCATCRVQAECLDWALDRDERFGIWGGVSERERRKLKAALSDTTQPEQQESA